MCLNWLSGAGSSKTKLSTITKPMSTGIRRDFISNLLQHKRITKVSFDYYEDGDGELYNRLLWGCGISEEGAMLAAAQVRVSRDLRREDSLKEEDG